jgi:uncharacterized protein
MNNPAETPTLLEFPCEFPIKIMGLMQDDFSQTMLEIVLRHAPDLVAEKVEMRASSGGKYVSITYTIRATSKPQLDNLYRELTAHPLVKMAL